MSVRLKSIGLLLITLFIILLAATGCVSDTFTNLTNVDIEPPKRGLLAALQNEQMPSPEVSGYLVKVSEINGNPVEVGEMELQLEVTTADGHPVTKFTEDMTKLMHLIVVSKDLSSFQHVHPDYVKDNVFRTKLNLPFAGSFYVTSEFKPHKQNVVINKQWIQVSGEPLSNETIVPDTTWIKSVSGLEVSLSASPGIGEIEAGQMVMLLFRFIDKDTGKPIKEIEPFLGTSGHCVILNSIVDQFVHAHAMEAMSGGANVMFHTVFPEKGIYKLWGQFQFKGEVLTVPFVITVK